MLWIRRDTVRFKCVMNAACCRASRTMAACQKHMRCKCTVLSRIAHRGSVRNTNAAFCHCTAWKTQMELVVPERKEEEPFSWHRHHRCHLHCLDSALATTPGTNAETNPGSCFPRSVRSLPHQHQRECLQCLVLQLSSSGKRSLLCLGRNLLIHTWRAISLIQNLHSNWTEN